MCEISRRNCCSRTDLVSSLSKWQDERTVSSDLIEWHPFGERRVCICLKPWVSIFTFHVCILYYFFFERSIPDFMSPVIIFFQISVHLTFVWCTKLYLTIILFCVYRLILHFKKEYLIDYFRMYNFKVTCNFQCLRWSS